MRWVFRARASVALDKITETIKTELMTKLTNNYFIHLAQWNTMAWRVCVVAAIFGTKSKAVNTYRLKQLRVHVVRIRDVSSRNKLINNP